MDKKEYVQLIKDIMFEQSSNIVKRIKQHTEDLVTIFNDRPHANDDIIDPLLWLRHYIDCYIEKLDEYANAASNYDAMIKTIDKKEEHAETKK